MQEETNDVAGADETVAEELDSGSNTPAKEHGAVTSAQDGHVSPPASQGGDPEPTTAGEEGSLKTSPQSAVSPNASVVVEDVAPGPPLAPGDSSSASAEGSAVPAAGEALPGNVDDVRGDPGPGEAAGVRKTQTVLPDDVTDTQDPTDVATLGAEPVKSHPKPRGSKVAPEPAASPTAAKAEGGRAEADGWVQPEAAVLPSVPGNVMAIEVAASRSSCNGEEGDRETAGVTPVQKRASGAIAAAAPTATDHPTPTPGALATAIKPLPHERVFVPLNLARTRLSALVDALTAMKARHVDIVGELEATYSQMETATKEQFTGFVTRLRQEYDAKIAMGRRVIQQLRQELSASKGAWQATEQSLRQRQNDLMRENATLLAQAGAALDGLEVTKKATEADLRDQLRRQANAHKAVQLQLDTAQKRLQVANAEVTVGRAAQERVVQLRQHEKRLRSLVTKEDAARVLLLRMVTSRAGALSDEPLAEQRQATLLQHREAQAKLDVALSEIDEWRARFQEEHPESDAATEADMTRPDVAHLVAGAHQAQRDIAACQGRLAALDQLEAHSSTAVAPLADPGPDDLVRDDVLDEVERSIPTARAATAGELGLMPGSVAPDGRSAFTAQSGDAQVEAARAAEVSHALATVEADTERRLAAERMSAEAALQREREDLGRRVAKGQEEIRELRAEVDRLRAASEAAEQGSLQQAAALASLRRAGEIDLQSAQGEADRLRAALLESRASVETLQQERLASLGEVDAAAEVAKLCAQVKRLQADLDARQQEVVSNVVSLRREEAASGQLRTDLVALRTQLEEAKAAAAEAIAAAAAAAASASTAAAAAAADADAAAVAAVADTATSAAVGPSRENEGRRGSGEEALLASQRHALELEAQVKQLQEQLADALLGGQPESRGKKSRAISGKPGKPGKASGAGAVKGAGDPATLGLLKTVKAELAETSATLKETQAKLAKAEAGPSASSLVVQKAEKSAKDAERRVENYKKQDTKQKEEIARLKNALTLVEKSDVKLKAELKATREELIGLNAVAAESVGAAEQLAEAKAQLKALAKDAKMHQENYNQERILRKKYYNTIEDMKGKIRVYARARPLSTSEKERGNYSVLQSPDEYTLVVAQGNKKKEFSFDQVFMPDSTQEQVYDDTHRLIQSAVDGYNVCIFAYGQTGSGKTFTMIGDSARPMNFPGLAPRAFADVFSIIKENENKYRFRVSCYMIEIYRDRLCDLFGSQRRHTAGPEKLKVHLNKRKMVFVEGAIVKPASSAEELYAHFESGAANRKVATTNMNSESSRSHLIIGVVIESTNLTTGSVVSGKLSLVDLAGSERAAKTGATGDQIEEAKSINRSLSALGDVISALSTQQEFIPYRNNILTLLMQDSLGGNAKTLMFVNISPADYNLEETVVSLTYASRVKLITNTASKNAESKEIARLKGIIKGLKTGVAVADEGEGEEQTVAEVS